MNLKSMLVYEEGRKHEPYKCTAGHWTVGVGHKLDINQLSKYEKGATDAQIDELLDSDISKAVDAATKYSWYRGLNEPRKAVIVSMIFQLGAAGFAKFQNTISLLASGRFESASEQMLRSLWARQTPNRAKRHAAQMKTGEWCEEYA